MKKTIPVLWMLIVIAASIYLESPISVQPADSQGFSAMRSMEHMEAMASKPHFMGTTQNHKVRDYILNEFKKLNIETELYTGICEKEFRGYKKIAQTENIIATIKGTASIKAVVLAGHYDSVLSAPGAADDVHAVACMLETARLLTKERPKNDIIFLITDGEEMGLLGAKAFVENKNLDHIGVLFNYEARGNSGAGIFFEWSEGNSWLVKEMRKACTRPVSNSMAYEIYNKLPNDTDFTHFKAAGIKGINHAFIDDFSYYHNPADKPENINMNTVQHTGENMWRMSKHFGELNLVEIPSNSNASFFNFFGSLIIYPASLDLLIILLLLLITALNLKSDVKSGVRLKNIILSLLAIMTASGIMNALAFFMGKALLMLYPQYQHFYTGQFYNHKWYILCSTGIALISFGLLCLYFIKKDKFKSVKSSSLLYLTLLSVGLYFALPTASYIMSLPTLALGIVHYLNNYTLKSDTSKKISSYLFSLIPLGIWGPVIITLFLAFSIKLLLVPAVITSFLAMGSIILFPQSWHSKNYLCLGGAMLVLGFAVAHSKSKPTHDKPLPSSLFYHYNKDTNKAWWVSNDPVVNEGNQNALSKAEFRELSFPNPLNKLSTKAVIRPAVSLPSATIDSLSESTVVVSSINEVFKSRLYIPNTSNIKELYLNGIKAYGKENKESSYLVDLLGFAQENVEIKLIKADSSKIDTVIINSMIRSVPKKFDLPDNCLRTDNYSSITQSITM